MKKFGLIGHPIDQSKSPLLFKAGYSGKYVYDLIEGEDFYKSYKTFLTKYDGINVTAPFKEKAAANAHIKSPIVEKTGAANLLIKTSNGVEAHNTDFYGIILAIIDGVLPEGGAGYFSLHGLELEPIRKLLTQMYHNSHKALVVGCGGAGKAAAAAAASLGYEVTVTNRTLTKAYALADKMHEHKFKVADIEDFCKLVRENDLIIYTIPSRIPQMDGLRTEDFNSKRKIVLEANYKDPAFSGEIAGMITAGKGKYISGRRWLLYQALTGYGIFTGENPDFERMDQEL